MLSYRGDIDGLRAIAVLSVILFHIDFALLPGGFVGVDIFFVISGYLITRLIFAEIEAQRFSFGTFFTRRVRRILPVFFVVMACTVAVGMVLLLPADRWSLFDAVRYATFFGANVFYSREGGYFDLASDEKPLLHIWSLSVEEQFYFIWPTLLIVLAALATWATGQETRERGQGAVAARRLLVASVGVLVVMGFALAQWISVGSGVSQKSYFLLQTRFGELLLGAFVSFLPTLKSRWQRETLGLAGILLIAYALRALSRESVFPGLNAVYPCLGTGLLIYAGTLHEGSQPLISRLLKSEGLRKIGLISYSAYLWHWPILAYMRYVYGEYHLPSTWGLSAFTLTLMLAWASYRLVERPARHAVSSFPRAAVGFYVIPAAVLLTLCYYGKRAATAPQPDATLMSYGADVCHGNLSMRCVRGDASREPTVLVIGDSHAAALNDFIDVVGKKEKWSAMVVSASSCSPVMGFDENALPDFARKPCVDLKTFVEQNYRKYGKVVIASYWAFQLGWLDLPSDKHYLEKFRKTVTQIAQTTPVYVVSDVPRLAVSPFRLAHFQRIGLSVFRPEPRQFSDANKVIAGSVRGIPNVHWVDLTPALRSFDNFAAYRGLPTYFDNQHLNEYGSTSLGKVFSQMGTLIAGS